MLVATPIGFEPTISTVTGWHVRPLHHGAALTKGPSLLRQPRPPKVYQYDLRRVKRSVPPIKQLMTKCQFSSLEVSID
jgi:hypothetical protein